MDTIIGRSLMLLNSSRTMGSVRRPVTTTRAGKCRMSVRTAPVSTTEQPERWKQNDKRSQHALSCRPIDLRINRRGWRSGSGDPQDKPDIVGRDLRNVADQIVKRDMPK